MKIQIIVGNEEEISNAYQLIGGLMALQDVFLFLEETEKEVLVYERNLSMLDCLHRKDKEDEK